MAAITTLLSLTAATGAAGASRNAASTIRNAPNVAAAVSAVRAPTSGRVLRDERVNERARRNDEREVRDRIGPLDALGVDERVRGDDGADRQPKPHVPRVRRFPSRDAVRKAPNPTRRTPAATESTPTTAPAGTPSSNAIAPTTSTTTGADPRAIGYTTDTSPPSYARASRTK